MLVPMQRYASIRARNSSGRSRGSARRRKVRFGSALDTTRRAAISSPVVSRTPVAAPPRVTIRSTSAFVRISQPASRAASAISSVTRPMPPRTNPHCRTPPSAASLAWSCNSTNAVPGVDGPATESLIACHPSAASTYGDEKYSDRYWVADVENRKARSASIRRWRNASLPHRAASRRSRPVRIAGSGAIQSNAGTTPRTSRARSSSKGPSAAASDGENRFVSSTLAAMSSPSRYRAPSGAMLSVGPAGSTTTPRRTSRMSRQIDSRSIDKT